MLTPNSVQGDMVSMVATNRMHFGSSKITERKPDEFISDFANSLEKAFYKVNDLQLESDRLTEAMAVRPDSVDIHDVTIAAEKARLALQFTKSVVERITQAYRELSNLR
jgi:flagellar hook-basal body complex protein FliE